MSNDRIAKLKIGDYVLSHNGLFNDKTIVARFAGKRIGGGFIWIVYDDGWNYSLLEPELAENLIKAGLNPKEYRYLCAIKPIKAITEAEALAYLV